MSLRGGEGGLELESCRDVSEDQGEIGGGGSDFGGGVDCGSRFVEGLTSESNRV